MTLITDQYKYPSPAPAQMHTAIQGIHDPSLLPPELYLLHLYAISGTQNLTCTDYVDNISLEFILCQTPHRICALFPSIIKGYFRYTLCTLFFRYFIWISDWKKKKANHVFRKIQQLTCPLHIKKSYKACTQPM